MLCNAYSASAMSHYFQNRNRISETAIINIGTADEVSVKDLQLSLELLCSTHDVQTKLRLFSILAVRLLSNHTNNDVIVTYTPLYDTIQQYLSKGLPRKSITVLNFLTALLVAAENDMIRGEGLSMYAKNKLRVSGCLSTLSDLFISSMVCQDTWIALCSTLAEVCRSLEMNQNHCSHLVPLCVRRCKKENIEVCTLLQSLLHNHERNIDIFLKNDGISIFTRELMQHNIALQLLNEIVQISTPAILLLRQSQIVGYLNNFLRLYGPQSKIGQWATLILFYCETRPKKPVVEINSNEIESSNLITSINKSIDTKQCDRKRPLDVANDTMKLFQNIMKEIYLCKTKHFDFPKPIFPIHVQKTFAEKENSEHILLKKGNDWHIRHDLYQNAEFLDDFKSDFQVKSQPSIRAKKLCTTSTQTSESENKELTFSSLFEENLKESSTFNDALTGLNGRLSKCRLLNNDSKPTSSISEAEITSKEYTVPNSHDFKPTFASTPKQRCVKNTEGLKKSDIKQTKKHHGIGKKRSRKIASPITTIKQRSMRSRFLNAINESCTSLVKSVTSIFMAKKNAADYQRPKYPRECDDNSIAAECSYSFTNYMRHRDSVLFNDCTATRSFESNTNTVNSCKSCNDTAALRRKLKNNVYLKKTVKKLKLGINLFGCDFKKISKTMWPRETFMTPNVLYNLYRKLIVNKH